MKDYKFLATIIVLLSVLFFNTCDLPVTNVDTRSFDKKLRGTWVSNDPGIYSGSLKITSNTITIDGYGETQTPQNGDDSNRPFKNIPKRVGHSGYSERVLLKDSSEEGNIFIGYGDAALNGIPYVFTEGGKYPNEYKLLEFIFGDRKEILQLQATGF
jgi:hypothetical protein